MTLLAVILAGLTILLVGILVGYLWGREDGHRQGYDDAYLEVGRFYARRDASAKLRAGR